VRKTDNFAGRGAERVDQNACPESGSILPNAPTLRFVFSSTRRGFKNLVRNAVVPILLGVKAGKVLADDFFALITLDALRSGIPVHNGACGIEHINRVVGDPLD